MKHTLDFVIILVVLLSTCVQADNENRTIFLDRGRRGIIPCPPITSHELTLEEIGVVYWYEGQIDGPSLLISYFRGMVTPQNGIPEGVYDINDEFSLVIENVTDSHDGNYWYKIKPRQKTAKEGNVTVNVIVTPNQAFPSVIGCDHTSSNPTECEVHIPYDTTSYSLTCEIRNAKPPAEIRWLREFEDKRTVDVTSTQTVKDIVLPGDSTNTDWFWINNTYTTSASILLSPSTDEYMSYRCEAYGIALGSNRGSYVTATAIIAPPPDKTDAPTTSYDEDVTLIGTDVPAPTFPLVIAISFGVVAVTVSILPVMFMILRFIRFMRSRRNTQGHRQRDNSVTSYREDLPLMDFMDLPTCQGILKSYFLAKMQNISIDLSTENDADAMPTDEIFIDLELHEKDKMVTIESREKMIQSFGGPRNRKHFVVKGAAGCGKTTLARRFGFDWGKESEYMNQFSLVFVLKMKEMTDSSGLCDAILKQNFPKDKLISVDRLRAIIDEAGERVLIILDGLDEMKTTILNTPAPDGDISVRDVLAVDALADRYVIVTTRPHMMKNLFSFNEDRVYTVIETTGFTQKNRNEYIRGRFRSEPTKGDRLIREIEEAAFLEILAKKPIMLILLCCICKDGEPMPTRITKLYDRAMKVLKTHWTKKKKISPRKSGRKWNIKRQEELGKVAFEGLMDGDGERLTFSHSEFTKKTLKVGFKLGLFTENTQSERRVTFLHKTFQEYFAAFYLARRTREFIEQNLLLNVTIDTIERVEYLLRFSCGMGEMAASVILHHVANIKDDLISDRYLWVQHLTLMLYYEAQSDILEAGVGSRLALRYHEEFEALQYYVNNISTSNPNSENDPWSCLVPKVRLERLEIYLHVIKDQSNVRSILRHVGVDNLYFGLLVSDTLKEELEQLAETISGLPTKPAKTIVCINKKTPDRAAEDVLPDVQGVAVATLVNFCLDKSDVIGFGMRVECDIINTLESFTALAANLAISRAVYFGVLNNNLNGYLHSISPLIPCLKYIELYDCGLRAGDLESLAKLLPDANSLRELYISGGIFTEVAVDTLVCQLTQCPKMLMLELHDTGLDEDIIHSAVKHYFQEMEPVTGNIKGQFWLHGKKSPEVPNDSQPLSRSLGAGNSLLDAAV